MLISVSYADLCDMAILCSVVALIATFVFARRHRWRWVFAVATISLAVIIFFIAMGMHDLAASIRFESRRTKVPASAPASGVHPAARQVN